MAFAIRSELVITGDDFGVSAERMENLGPLYKQVGVFMMSRGVDRLTQVLAQTTGGVRSNRLIGSLQVGVAGGGGGDTIFRPLQNGIEVGSNVPYAAQRQFGGTILPKKGKALAIPLLERLKRHRLSPRDFPSDSLDFIPAKRGGGVIGFLVDADERAGIKAGKSRKRDLRRRTALFMLVRKVTQPARPFLFFDDRDNEDIGRLTVDFLEAA